MSLYELKNEISIAYGNLPYMVKRSCVDIIHFFELFTKYDLLNASTGIGFAEQIQWESLVESYLEKVHSCIDKQRSVFEHVSEYCEVDLSAQRNEIILPKTIEHELIIELRRAHHHHALTITRFWSRPGSNNESLPIPGIAWFQVELGEAAKKYTDTIDTHGDGIPDLFKKHCYQFLNKSKALKTLLENAIEETSK